MSSFTSYGTRGWGFPAQVILLSASLMSVFLAGGPHQAGMGMFLTFAGGVLLLFPLQKLIAWWVWFLALLFVCTLSLSLLPSKWLLLPDEWNFFLRDVPGLIPGFTKPACISGDPKSTFFWIAVLSSSLLAGLYCMACALGRGKLRWLALFVCVGCSLYAGIAALAWTTGWVYPFFSRDSWAQPAFGFFPNRNHTAGFLLTGVIISLGLMQSEINARRVLASLIATFSFLLLTGSLLFFSISRGGLLFVVIGFAIWVLGLGKYRSGALLGFSGILFSVMLILFLHSDTGLIKRLHGESLSEHGEDSSSMVSVEQSKQKSLAQDPRISIAEDTFQIIAVHPLTGTGLGTFSLIYPFYAKHSLRDQARALHAESDWLTLTSEAGVPAVLIVVVALGIISTKIPKLALLSGSEWPLRWAFIAAFFAELIQGLVDVPLHRDELGWWIMLLGGIGFGGAVCSDSIHQGAARFQRIFFIAGGVATMVLGVCLIMAQWGYLRMPPFAPELTSARLVKLSSKGDENSLRDSMAECRKAISDYPLYHPFYYQLALLSLRAPYGLMTAEGLFAVERRLQPSDPSLAFEQGKVLEDVDPDCAVEIWKEALRRRLALDARPNCPIARSTELFSSMISVARMHPALLERFPSLVGILPVELKMIWYGCSECPSSMIAAAVEDGSFMKSLDPRQQGHLIELWSSRTDDKKQIEDFLRQHPQYIRAAAATSASILASAGHQKEACLFLVDLFHLDMPELSSLSVHSAGQDVPLDPLDAAHYYLEKGNEVAARRLVIDALSSEQGTTKEAQALFLKAALEMNEKNWTEALASILDFLRSTKQL